MLIAALLLAAAPVSAPACVRGPVDRPAVADRRSVMHAFQNGERQPLRLWWLDPAGAAADLGVIAPGGVRSINTFVGHRFALTRPDGHCARGLAIEAVFSGSYVGRSRYRATRTPGGWHVLVDRALSQHARNTRDALAIVARMLTEIAAALPPAALAEVRRTPIFVHRHAGPGAMFHPDPDWLVAHGRTVELTRGIEISDADLFIRDSRVQPGTILHELAHAYHRQLPAADLNAIEASYRHAIDTGPYRAVKRHDGSTIDAYARTNAAEYYAELTEAYFSRNDFAPFTRSELVAYDPRGARVVAAAWGMALPS